MKALILGAMTFLWLGTTYAAAPTTVVLDVANMTCPACGLTIKAALRHEPGVSSTEVDGKAGTVTVNFDAELTTVDRVAVAITESGFPAKPQATHDD
jgi:mercuric ion binding protein